MLFVCHCKILHKHCLQFLLGVKMAPRETENNAYAKFGVTNKEHYGMLWYFLECSVEVRLDVTLFWLKPLLLLKCKSCSSLFLFIIIIIIILFCCHVLRLGSSVHRTQMFFTGRHQSLFIRGECGILGMFILCFSPNLSNIECFHMTSRRPYWCPKTMKRPPFWCPKPILWELNSFLMQTPFFCSNKFA